MPGKFLGTSFLILNNFTRKIMELTLEKLCGLQFQLSVAMTRYLKHDVKEWPLYLYSSGQELRNSTEVYFVSAPRCLRLLLGWLGAGNAWIDGDWKHLKAYSEVNADDQPELQLRQLARIPTYDLRASSHHGGWDLKGGNPRGPKKKKAVLLLLTYFQKVCGDRFPEVTGPPW